MKIDLSATKVGQLYRIEVFDGGKFNGFIAPVFLNKKEVINYFILSKDSGTIFGEYRKDGHRLYSKTKQRDIARLYGIAYKNKESRT